MFRLYPGIRPNTLENPASLFGPLSLDAPHMEEEHVIPDVADPSPLLRAESSAEPRGLTQVENEKKMPDDSLDPADIPDPIDIPDPATKVPLNRSHAKRQKAKAPVPAAQSRPRRKKYL